MYRIYLTNFGYFMDFATDDIKSAVNKAMSCGFECSIYKGNELIASYSPIGGMRTFKEA